ncbi:unnamed protein product [Paramecium octaurelia]|uniref:Uncharacterized protein n=1 Tax=Paramecium octaurelia TaxID=43137 RepID=A0A8S1U873_PAROT|nr:unnamed protein product [Paramecium octaurelia]
MNITLFIVKMIDLVDFQGIFKQRGIQIDGKRQFNPFLKRDFQNIS